jgi:hypothetical protein
MNPQEADLVVLSQDYDEDIEDMGILILSDECDTIQTAVSVCKYTAGCFVLGAIGLLIFR